MKEKTEKTYEKLEQGLKEKKSVVIRIGGRRLAVHPEKDRARWTICWHDGVKRQKKNVSDDAEVRGLVKRIIAAFEQGEKVVDNLSAERLSEYIDIDTTLRGVNLHELVAHYKEHLERKSTPLSTVCEMYLSARSDNSPRHCDTLRLHLQKLCSKFKGSINAIKAQDLDEYLLNTFPGLKTRLGHRGTICALFAFAQRKGILPIGFTEAQKSERPKISVVEPCTVSSQDMTRLLNECTNPRLASFLAIAAFAGCRSAEIQRLKWKDIWEEDPRIVLGVHITKTKRRRIAEVSPNLKAWIDILRREPEEYVTYPESEFYTLYAHLSDLCKKLDITKEQNALRHTFVSCHLELHRDAPRTAKSAGHSLAMLETNYLKLVPLSEAEAWFNIFPTEGKTYDPIVIRSKRVRMNTVAVVVAAIAARNKSAKQYQERNKYAKPTK